MKEHQVTIERHLGAPLRDKLIFEIGPGQLLKNARFFGACNRVIAVDLDEIVSAWDMSAWLKMLHKNGPLRVAKTLARKVAGIDRSFLKELARQMPASVGPRIQVLQRDAADSGLESGSFDCAVSFSVFEHLPEPRRVFREIVRLLRPGGVGFHILHCFTSDSGAHDVRSYFIERSNLPYWCHLRPDKAHLVSTNAYLNRLRIDEWKKLIIEELPGAEIVDIVQWRYPRLVQELKNLRGAGELKEYSDEELMTVCLQVSWVRPELLHAHGRPELLHAHHSEEVRTCSSAVS
jgi:SAM-dependent methyltransferase